jgi:hypothetical protein
MLHKFRRIQAAKRCFHSLRTPFRGNICINSLAWTLSSDSSLQLWHAALMLQQTRSKSQDVKKGGA